MEIQCCNRKPKCKEMITLTKEDLSMKKHIESLGFVFAKLCDKHIKESYQRSLAQ
jgi:hypothetical protein